MSDSNLLSDLKELARLSDDELNQISIAQLNLVCASGLRGSEDLDVESCIATLEQWADEVCH